MSHPRPDLPAAARLLEAARSYRMAARQLRRAHPPRRIESQRGQVDVAPDGRVLALRVLGAPGRNASDLARHLVDLAQGLSRGSATGLPDGAVVSDLPEDQPIPHALEADRRFRFPSGIDASADPAVVMAQLRTHLASRWARAHTVGGHVAEMVGQGVVGGITVRVQAHGLLEGLELTPEAITASVDDLNAGLAEALASAQHDLRRRVDAALDHDQVEGD